MTNLEFQETLNTLNIKECLFIPNGGKMNRDFDDIYFTNGVALSFDGKNLVEVNGFVPLEVAQKIYQNYPLGTMTKRLYGNEEEFSSDPVKVKSKGDYEQAIQFFINKKYVIALPEQRKEIIQHLLSGGVNYNDEYITRYFIYDKEDLLIFLLEMQNYININSNLPKIALLKYDQLLEQINHNLLVKIGADKDTNDWTLNYQCANTDKVDDKIKAMLDKFDKTINPFMDKSLSLVSFKEMSSNINVSIGNKNNNNNYELVISDLSSKCSYTSMERGVNFYIYKLSNIEDENNYFMLEHLCLPTKDNEKKRFCEKIIISDATTYLEYDICNHTVVHNYKEKTFIKQGEKEYIFNQLLKAISIASNITINNMLKKDLENQNKSLKKKM